MVPRTDLSGVSALLQEFLHHPQRYPVAMSNLFAGALFLVVGQIGFVRAGPAIAFASLKYATSALYGYSFI